MEKKYVNLNSIAAVKDFVQITSTRSFEVDLGTGRFVIDGKSIMGVFSLDLSNPIELNIIGNVSEEEAEAYFSAIKDYIVDAPVIAE